MRNFAVISGVLLGLLGPCTISMADSVAMTLRSSNGSSIQNVFSERPDLGSAPELKYFPEPKKVYEFPEEEEQEQPAETPNKSEATDPKSLAEQRKPLRNKEDIIEVYGDPSESQPVLAQADAPAPFQAMMHAMNLGDQKLAFAYARKYVRYIRDLRNNNRDVVGLIAKSYEREGVEDGEGWTGAAEFDRYNKLLEEDIAEEKLKQDYDSLLENADDETRALISRAEEFERSKERDLSKGIPKHRKVDKFLKEPETPARLLDSEASGKEAIRSKLAGKVPVAPDGRITVTFFFQPRDKQSLIMGAEVAKLAQAFATDSRINFQAYSVESALMAEVEYFRKKTKMNFMVDGSGLEFLEMQKRKAPSLEFSIDATGRLIREEGVRGFIYLQELLTMMQGGGQK